ncbi:MAG: hypothetical protein ACP5QI_05465 [Candidatus Bathyarchaeia archaeon]
MRRSIIVLASMAALAMLLCGSMISIHAKSDGGGAPDSNRNGRFKDGKHLPWMKELMRDLTPDQRREIYQLIQEMKESGSTPEEIKEAVDAKLAEWGIGASESPGPTMPNWMKDLTEEQREEIKQLLETMKRNGATREEMIEAVLQRLKEYGIDTSNLKINHQVGDGSMRRHREHLLDRLTEEQRNGLLQKVQELRESGATRTQIREMIHAQLEEWGIKPPECLGP